MTAPADSPAPSSYDKAPATRLGPEHVLWRGAEAFGHLRQAAEDRGPRAVVAVDTYPGVDVDAVLAQLRAVFGGFDLIDLEDEAAKPSTVVDQLIEGNLTDDRVFGVLSHATVDLFYDDARTAAVAARVRDRSGGVVVVGWGAARVLDDAGVAPADSVLVLADLARWEIQQRYRAGGTNWRSDNGGEDILRKYKRGFFVEWRVADRHKRTLLDRVDLALDTTRSVADAGLITGTTLRAGLARTVA